MRDERGQTSAEYMGILLVVAAIVGALLASGLHREVAAAARSAICTITGDSCEGAGGPAAVASSGPDSDGDGVSDRDEQRAGTNPRAADTDGDGSSDAEERAAGSNPTQVDTDGDGVLDGDDPVAMAGDADGDGLSDGEEIALGTDPRKADSDDDGRADRVEYEEGTDPLQRVAPLTRKNVLKPWERVGMSEDEWRDFEREVLDEVSPDGLEGFLVGSPYIGVTLDEEGKLKFIEVQQMGLSPGPLLKALGVGGRAVSAGAALTRALGRIPAATQARLIARGVLPRTGPLRRPPVPPASAGTAVNELDALGRATGASATITRETLRTGTKASSSAEGRRLRRSRGGPRQGPPDRAAAGRERRRRPQPDHAVSEPGQHARHVKLRAPDRPGRGERADGALPGDADLPRVGAGPARRDAERARQRRLPAQRHGAEQAQARPMSDLDDLRALAPPPADPPPAADWETVGAQLPPDFVELAERYGAGTFDSGIAILVPGHPNHFLDLARQVEEQRSALRYLRDEGAELPTTPTRCCRGGSTRAAMCCGGTSRATLQAGVWSPTRRVATSGSRSTRARSRRSWRCSPGARSPTSSSSTRARRSSGAMRRGAALIAAAALLAGCGGGDRRRPSRPASGAATSARCVEWWRRRARRAAGRRRCARRRCACGRSSRRARSRNPTATWLQASPPWPSARERETEVPDVVYDRVLAARRAFALRRYDIGVYGPLR